MKAEIYEKIILLNKKFYEIQCKNWIKSRGIGFSAVGETFELLLEKKRDKNILPDYYGIELKTKLYKTDPYIGLFSMALDNKPLRMKRLYEIGGYPSRRDRRYKVLYVKIYAPLKTKIGFRYSYQLKVNYSNQVIHLLIFDCYNGLLNEDMSWSFTEIKKKIRI